MRLLSALNRPFEIRAYLTERRDVSGVDGYTGSYLKPAHSQLLCRRMELKNNLEGPIREP